MYRSAADSKNVEAMVKDIRFVDADLCVCSIVCVRLRFFCDPLSFNLFVFLGCSWYAASPWRRRGSAGPFFGFEVVCTIVVMIRYHFNISARDSSTVNFFNVFTAF
jgi:hypothetical protein